MPRKRTKTTTSTGTAEGWNSNGVPGYVRNQTVTINKSYCEDEDLDPGGNHMLLITHESDKRRRFSGTRYWGNGHLMNRLTNIVPSRHMPAYPGDLNLANPSAAQLVTRMMVDRPKVDLPLFLYELKDIPKMVENIGGIFSFAKALPDTIRLIQTGLLQSLGRPGISDLGRKGLRYNPASPKGVKGLANTHLAIEMGWNPLVSDLTQMIGLADDFERRMSWLNTLHGKGSLRRKITIDSSTRSEYFGNVQIAIYETTAAAYGNHHRQTTSKKWATCRWSYNQGAKPDTPPSATDVWRSLLGVRYANLGTLYNAVPWSFVIDYFTDLGDWVTARSNEAVMQCSHLCVMRHDVVRSTFTRTVRDSDKWVSGGDGVYEWQKKSRLPLSIGLPTFEPFLTQRQVSNLASLSVARNKNWH